MITEDYVSFETAKLLEEKGFDCEKESITAMYREDGKFFSLSSADPYYYDYDDFDEYDYIAPTLQMAMKWLRKKYNLHITLPYYIEGFYGFEICDIKKSIVVGHNAEDIKYVEPEEACEAAIKYCLENLI